MPFAALQLINNLSARNPRRKQKKVEKGLKEIAEKPRAHQKIVFRSLILPFYFSPFRIGWLGSFCSLFPQILIHISNQ